jgi:hypothetical protein
MSSSAIIMISFQWCSQRTPSSRSLRILTLCRRKVQQSRRSTATPADPQKLVTCAHDLHGPTHFDAKGEDQELECVNFHSPATGHLDGNEKVRAGGQVSAARTGLDG